MSGIIIRLGISALCLAAVFAMLADIGDVANSISSIGVVTFLLGLAIVIGDRFMMTFKWILLLRTAGRPLSLFRGMVIYCTSTLLGSVLPTTAGSDVIRGVWTARNGIPGGHVAASILVERFTGFISILILGIFSQAYLVTRPGINPRFQALLAASVCIFVAATASAVVILHPRTSRWLVTCLPERIARTKAFQAIAGVLDACRELGAARSTLLTFFLLTMIEQLFPVILVVTLAEGLGLSVSIGWIFSGLMLSLIVTRLPISIDGIGVFEAVFAGLMALGGVPAADSVAIAFAGRLLQVIACAPWAIPAIRSRYFSASAPPASPTPKNSAENIAGAPPCAPPPFTSPSCESKRVGSFEVAAGEENCR